MGHGACICKLQSSSYGIRSDHDHSFVLWPLYRAPRRVEANSEMEFLFWCSRQLLHSVFSGISWQSNTHSLVLYSTNSCVCRLIRFKVSQTCDFFCVSSFGVFGFY